MRDDRSLSPRAALWLWILLTVVGWLVVGLVGVGLWRLVRASP